MINTEFEPSSSAAVDHQEAAGLTDRISVSDMLLIAGSAILIILTEIWSVAISGLWALRDLLNLNLPATLVFGILTGAVSLWASYHTIRLAIATMVTASSASTASGD